MQAEAEAKAAKARAALQTLMHFAAVRESKLTAVFRRRW